MLSSFGASALFSTLRREGQLPPKSAITIPSEKVEIIIFYVFFNYL